MSDITDKYILLGQKIKERRKELDLTMKEVAFNTELSQSAISMIENGLRQPTLQTINRISKVLGVDFSKYLASDDPVLATQPIPIISNALSLQVLDYHLTLAVESFSSIETSIEQNEVELQLSQQVKNVILAELEQLLNNEHTVRTIEEKVAKTLIEDYERKKQEIESRLHRQFKK